MATSGGSGETITVARLMEMLSHAEWQCHVIRVALNQLGAQTRLAVTGELKDVLAKEQPNIRYIDPPC